MTTIAPESLALAARLRSATTMEHDEAESMAFVTKLMGGELPIAALADFHAQHLAIYRALEEAGDALVNDPVAGDFVFEQLRRVPSLKADLEFLIDGEWENKIEVTQAAEEYAARIREAGVWAGGFIGHAYVRYLGDLSGGQAIGRLMQRAYGLEREGISFYHFEGIKPKPFKDSYRKLLDEADFTEDQRDQVVEEAKLAFRLNTAMFAELATRHC